MPRRRPPVDVLVIGGGAAGLAAARDCSQAGRTVALLEARGRLGGRIHTLHDPHWPVPVELGAEFLHGTAEDTMRIARAAGLAVNRLPDHHYTSRRGQLGSVADFWEAIEKLGKDIGRKLARAKARDFSLADYLDRTSLSTETRQLLIDFVEGYHAAHLDRVSARVMAAGDEETRDDGGSDQQHRIPAGYDRVIHWLRGGLDPERVEVRLNTTVTELAWSKGEVTASCRSGTGAEVDGVRALCAIVAIPHALLRMGLLRFRPDPGGALRAAERLEVGQVFKIVLRFRAAFWSGTTFVKERLEQPRAQPEELNFVHAHGLAVPTWWTQLPAQAPVLTGWAGGPRAETLLVRDELGRVDQALDALGQALRVPRRLLDDQLEAWAMHDWQADLLSRGAYTYPGVGGTAAQHALARPVQGTLAFAGEFTDAEQTGTVAGAIASGRRAAKQLL